MPGGDKTGPMGNGPMTGWGKGICLTDRSTSVGKGIRSGVGRGTGRGKGFGPGAGMGAMYGCGRGFGRFWWGSDIDADPKEMIKAAKEWEKENLAEERDLLKKRLDMIEAQLESEKEE